MSGKCQKRTPEKSERYCTDSREPRPLTFGAMRFVAFFSRGPSAQSSAFSKCEGDVGLHGGQPCSISSLPIALKVRGDEKTATSREAESLGLIVTELVINSVKHAFDGTTKDGQITVAFDVSGTDWKLSVTDNGIGTPDGVFAQPKTGLGTGIVNALAKQLNAKVETLSGSHGTSVSVTHATFAALKARAA